MKILNTDTFISERMKINPITRGELDKAKEDIKLKSKTEIDINKFSIFVFHKFGYVLQMKCGFEYITLGDNDPSYVKEFKNRSKICDYMAIMYGDTVDNKWFFIQKYYYIDFPHNTQNHIKNENYDIVKVFKTNIKPEDIETIEKLKNTYKRLGLRHV